MAISTSWNANKSTNLFLKNIYFFWYRFAFDILERRNPIRVSQQRILFGEKLIGVSYSKRKSVYLNCVAVSEESDCSFTTNCARQEGYSGTGFLNLLGELTLIHSSGNCIKECINGGSKPRQEDVKQA